MEKTFPTKTVVTVAVLAALSVILRLLGYPQTGSTRYDLGFVPIAAAGIMFGPWWSGAAYVLADLVGTFAAAQTPFIPITVCKFVFGWILGAFLYKKEVTLPRILLCVVTISLAVDLVAMPFALSPVVGNGVWAVAVSRLPQAAVMFPIRVLGIWILNKYLGKYMKKYSN